MTGKYGTITKSFKDVQVDMKLDKSKKKLLTEIWMVSEKMRGVANMIAAAVKNMINGVRRQYKFVMKAIYAHFPIHMEIMTNPRMFRVRNYLGNNSHIFLFVREDSVTIIHR